MERENAERKCDLAEDPKFSSQWSHPISLHNTQIIEPTAQLPSAHLSTMGKSSTPFYDSSWDAFKKQDPEAWLAQFTEDCEWVWHSNGKVTDKEFISGMLPQWMKMPPAEKPRCLYENKEVCVSHFFNRFPDATVEGTMMVQMLRKGKCYRVETGTTLIPEDSPNYIPNEAVIRHKIAMFGKFEDDAAEFSTEEATMGPPGSPAMPTAAMLDVMKKCREAFPDWKSVVHGVEGPNEDGSYTVYTQQVSGKMTGDLSLGAPFPDIPLKSAPKSVKKGGINFPVEVGTIRIDSDEKVTECDYSAAAITTDKFEPEAKPEKAIVDGWNKKGDFSDVGFGAFFGALGVALPPPPTDEDAIKADIRAFGENWEAKYATEECTVAPPGAPPMAIGEMNKTMDEVRKAFPDWKSIVHDVTGPNEDGTYTLSTQQVSGKMVADMVLGGPFPEATLKNAPKAAKKSGVRFPVEVGYVTVNGAGKVCKTSWVGDISNDFDKAAKPDKAILKSWNKKGDLSDVGFGALYEALGTPLPPPPAAAQ